MALGIMRIGGVSRLTILTSAAFESSSTVLWQPATVEEVWWHQGLEGWRWREGVREGQMDGVITRISEHEGGAMQCCHHRANSWRLKPPSTAGWLHARAEMMHTVHQSYHLHWREMTGQGCKHTRRKRRRNLNSFFFLTCCFQQNALIYKTASVMLFVSTSCHRLSSWHACFLSRWHLCFTPSPTHTWRIETLMELAVLLCQLLHCSSPNGQKFNYQLICRVVSSDMRHPPKLPIVSTPIKSSVLF